MNCLLNYKELKASYTAVVCIYLCVKECFMPLTDIAGLQNVLL